MGLFDFLNKEDEENKPISYEPKSAEVQPQSFDLDLGKMKKEQDDASAYKGLMKTAGSIFQNGVNAPSFYELHSGKKSERPDLQSSFNASAEMIGDPAERQAKLYQTYMGAKKAKEAQEQDAVNQLKKDPNSKQSLALKQIAPRWGIKTTPEMSAYDIEQLMDPKKMMETEAISRANLQNQKSLKDYDAEKDMEKAAFNASLDKNNLPQNVYQAATYGKRVEDANKQMEDLISKGYDPTSLMTAAKNKLIPDAFQSNDQKIMDQAQRNFINAVLRRESGSAISSSEFDSGNKQYFPATGDTPEVLEQKKRNREVALAGLKSEGAKAWPGLERNLPENSMMAHREGAPKANANPHPQDSQAVEWAKKNLNDPRAKQILKLNGL